IRKLPTKKDFLTFWRSELETPLEKKRSYCVIWLKNDIPLGHSNTRPVYFEKIQMKDLYCTPYALNPAPNRLLEKLGFDFVKEHRTIPGPSNFEQQVKLWHLSHQKFVRLYKTSA